MAYTRENHGRNKPTWRTGAHKPSGKRIGIELEIENPNGYNAILEALPETENDDMRPITERDGSLNEARGVEIVFPPFSHGSLRLETSFFGRSIKALADAGCVAHSECGMHMNINTKDWTEEQKSIFICWIHWVTATALVRIGGRSLNRWCAQNPYITLGNAIGHIEHVTCAGVRPNRIEVRFPKATVEHVKIKNLTNFFSHLEDFVKLPTTMAFMRDKENLERDARGTAMLEKFCAYLDTRTRASRSAATIKGVLLNGY